MKRAFGNCENCPRQRCAIWFVGSRLLCRACRDNDPATGLGIARLTPTSGGVNPCEFCGHEEELTQQACGHCNERFRLRVMVAIGLLESDHVQDNLHRLGVLGKQDIQRAIQVLTTRGQSNNQ